MPSLVPHRFRQAVFLLTPTLILLSAGARAQPLLPQKALHWPRSRNYDVLHYMISLDVDWRSWADKSVSGETDVTLRPLQSDLKAVDLDAGAMKIESVKLASGPPLVFHYDGKETLTVDLDHPYSAGTDLTLAIRYKTASVNKGIFFKSPIPTDPGRPYQIWTQGEPETNHYWFPCYDFPNEKSTSETLVTVDEKYRVISNGALVDVSADPSRRTRTWHWKMDRPHSSYLNSVIIGEFAEIKDQYDGIPVSTYVDPGQEADGKRTFGKIASIVAFFSKRLDYKYPYAKYAQTLVREPWFGGMENISATTLTDTSLQDERSLLDYDAGVLMSHELAHQWFGDLVTCRDWGEIWLNESFATFMASAWTEHDKGRDDYLYDVWEQQQAYYGAWKYGDRRPIVYKRYEDPNDVFGAYVYPRGAAVLAMLRFVLGEEGFWKSLHHYLERYQWQPVETGQLVVAIEEATGQNLQWFFDEWVYRGGHPVFRVTSKFDPAGKKLTLRVVQAQKPDPQRPWLQQTARFTGPMDIGITTAGGEKVHRVQIDGTQQVFTFDVDSRPLIVNFDRGNVWLKEVQFPRNEEDLAYQLRHDADVTGRIRAIEEIKGSKTRRAAEALADAAQHDAFWGARRESVDTLAVMPAGSAKPGLIAAAHDPDARVRSAAVYRLAVYRDRKLAGWFTDLIHHDPSYQVVAGAAQALAFTRAPGAESTLAELLAQDSWHDTLRTDGLRSLQALRPRRALALAFDYARPGHSEYARAAAFLAVGGLAKKPEEKDRALPLLTAALQEQAPRLRRSAVFALRNLADARAIPALAQQKEREDLEKGEQAQVGSALAFLTSMK